MPTPGSEHSISFPAMRRVVLAMCAFALIAGDAAAQQSTAARWYKGNTHAHTLNSDGDSPPVDVVRWYRTHGYQFTFITDHEYITDAAALNATFGRAERFLVMSGQEVSQRTSDPSHPDRARQAHINALGITRVIFPQGERYLAEPPMAPVYARNIAAIKAAGGVPQVNHPNFRWSVPLEVMAALPDSTLFELWNGHPIVYNLGGTDSLGNAMPSTEVLWDSLLTRGKLLFAVADDDSHSFNPEEADNPDVPRPGRGWVMVRADTLAPAAILSALRRGDFYASTGITLRRYEASASHIEVEVTPSSDIRYRIDFIGSGGRVLATSTKLRARYDITGTEGYVRARVTDSHGRRAWMQPVMVRR